MGGLIFAPPLLLFYVTLESAADVGTWLGVLGVVLLAIATPPVFRGIAPRLFQHAVVFALSLVFALAALHTGALAYICWLGVPLLLGYLFLGHRAGTRWMAVILAMGLCAIVSLALEPHVQLNVGEPIVRGVRVVSLLPVVAVLGWFYEGQRSKNIDALRRAAAVAEEASAGKSRMLAHVSHEVRTPLNALIGMTDVMLLEPWSAPTRARLETIQQSGRLLFHIVSDLLDVARAEAGRLELQPIACDLGALVEETLALHRVRASEKGLALELVQAGSRGPVSADATRFQQVVGNLVSNAIRYTDRGRVTVALTIDPTADGRRTVVLAVRDTGVGLTDSALRGLFEPFVQNRLGARAGGIGLGLVITRHIVERFGGSLDIESRPGEGSTFTVRFAVDAADHVAPKSKYSDVVQFSGRALVVDDNPINVKVAEALLTRLGMEVESVAGGEDALVAAARATPDIVFMDLQMPAPDGIETTQRLRAAGHRMPIFAVTASELPETERSCREAGMQGVLLKPLEVQRIAQLLATCSLPTTPG